ncbi:helix-turn-helix transcriptional regulator [Paraburkholderia susongensis]|uniref:Transcriptional regulator, AlpA family n=1 Tax=Paraburkholderia susongensis TaxID=1515439 RepID=A0A1X7JLM3_9BURK|nr:AlpA family transcriptional regulator [Paraburkholderia susongensis]SMG28268.1 transcriptional regulator, AlpA family [Paraburkholderia susongensis]
MGNRVLRIDQVLAVVPLKKSTVYKAMKAGTFPRPIRLGLKAVGWLEADIQDWINGRIAASLGQEKGGAA